MMRMWVYFAIVSFAGFVFFLLHIRGQHKPHEKLNLLRSPVPVITKFGGMGSLSSEPPPLTRSGPGEDTLVLLGIFTTLPEREQRQLIRDTYLGYGITDSRVCSLQDFMHWKDLKSSDATMCKVLYTFVMGSNPDGPLDHFRSDNPLLFTPRKFPGRELMPIVYRPFYLGSSKENVEYDSTYLNIQENTHAGKSITWWKHAAGVAESYEIDYVAKVASNTLVSMSHLMDFIITDLPPVPYNVRTYGGKMIHHGSKTEPGHIYASEQFIFMSRDLSAYIASDELDRQMIKKSRLGFLSDKSIDTEDLDTGTLVLTHPYPIKFMFLNQKFSWLCEPKDLVEWNAIWDNRLQGMW